MGAWQPKRPLYRGPRDKLKGMPLAIQADDVRAAAERIRPLARKTPVLTSAEFDSEAGARVFLQVREPAARRSVQDPRRRQHDAVAAQRDRWHARHRGVFLRQSRAGGGHRGEACGRAGDHRDAGGRAAVEDGSHARRTVRTSSHTTGSQESREAIARGHPERNGSDARAALRPSDDHGGAGHRRNGAAGRDRPAGRI